MRTDRRAVMSKLIVAFRKFSNAPKNYLYHATNDVNEADRPKVNQHAGLNVDKQGVRTNINGEDKSQRQR